MILLVGHLGSIGSRYAAILDFLKVDWAGYDVRSNEWIDIGRLMDSADGAIIATPTETHFEICQVANHYHTPFLCEKPLSKNAGQLRLMSDMDGYVVNNYQFCIGRKNGNQQSLEYNYFKTGRDGLWWDVCQILYLDADAKIGTTSPVWRFLVDGVPVPYLKLEMSYIDMVSCWLKSLGWSGPCDYEKEWLWTVKDGILMTERVLERIEYENAHRDSGTV